MARSIPVMEMYPAAQGEGSRVGVPSVFVRTFFCNLRCWWCDTAYSINVEEARKTLTVDAFGKLFERYEIASLVEKIQSFNLGSVVFTGGEPTMWIDELTEVAEELEPGVHTTIETNGTNIPTIPQFYGIDLWSISPKLPGSQDSEVHERMAAVDMEKWADLSDMRKERIQLKFVITDIAKDLDAAYELLKSSHKVWEKVPLFFVPNGDFYLENQRDGWEVWEKIVLAASDVRWRSFQVRVLPQIHVLAYGRKRFV